MEKPYSQACENNKDPILAVLREAFAEVEGVLEIGSGTGQHAVYFGRHLSHLSWQPSDVADNLPGIRAWLAEAALPNVPDPLVLDVNRQPWPLQSTGAVFSANSLHIMGETEVELFFAGIARVLAVGGVLCVYGPFNYNGRFTSESNARFELWLKQQHCKSGIRDFEWVNQLAEQAGLVLLNDYGMPANNRILEWRKAR